MPFHGDRYGFLNTQLNGPQIAMKLPRFFASILTGLFASILASAFVETTAVAFPLLGEVSPLASPAPSAVALAPSLNPWLGLIPLVVPILVTAVKSFVPKLPKVWLPVIAASVGLALALFDHFTGALGGNPMAVAFLGAAGTGLREIYDQLRQALAVPNA